MPPPVECQRFFILYACAQNKRFIRIAPKFKDSFEDIDEGQSITTLLFGANHDPAAHPNPERFDIERPDKKHSSFGGGIHFCLGAPLARAEAQIAIPLLLTRFPRLRLMPGHHPIRKSLPSFNGLESLWVDTD
jgi:cytochrome P450